jgi:predicted NAD/FAD-binding protein
MRIAIAGNGITGLSAAWLLNHGHQVTLYERNDYFGGYSNTRLVKPKHTQINFRSIFYY